MKVSELIPMKRESTEVEFNGGAIKVNKYISELYKLYIVKKIKDLYFAENEIISEEGSSLSSDDLSNKNLKHSALVSYVIQFYTDIEIDEDDRFVICDAVVESGLYDIIISKIPFSEMETLTKMINDSIEESKYDKLINKLDEVKADTLESQLSLFLQKAIDKIPNDKKLLSLIKSTKKEFNGFDLSKLDQVKSLMGALGEKEIPNVETLDNNMDSIKEFVSRKKK